MSNQADVYEVYALRFAHDPHGVRGNHFYGPEADAAGSHPTDYFFWLARSSERAVLIDAGFSAGTAQRRGRQYLAEPVDLLAGLGVRPTDVETLIVSHLHWDHIGHVTSFPDSRLVLQEQEMAFWTGRHSGRGDFARTLEADDVIHILRRHWEGGVTFVDGDLEVHPGLSVHLVGGHTPGTQITRIRTAVGHVVVASDACHFYENIERDRPFSVVNHLPSMYDAFDRITGLADGPELIVPGHDPLVLGRVPAG
jgi:glyoxylase-like metal-dependent hydrolase (beta-lactamase superfamily II)